MNKNKKNRREFLEIAGLSAIGIVVASTGIKTMFGVEASSTTRQMSFEDWVLQTGKDKLPADMSRFLSNQTEQPK